MNAWVAAVESAMKFGRLKCHIVDADVVEMKNYYYYYSV